METSLKLLELACFFDLNKVYLPTYLPTYLTMPWYTKAHNNKNHYFEEWKTRRNPKFSSQRLIIIV